MPLFSFDEIGKKKITEPGDKSEILRDSFLHQHEFKVKTLKELMGNVPERNEFIALWTLKSFNAFTFIPYLIHVFTKIDYLAISTYTINRRIIDSLIKKIDHGKIDHVKLFISDSLKYRMPKAVDHLEMMIAARTPQITAHYAWNHSKITLAQCDDHFFTIEGSENWSENAQYEQYLFFNNKRLYDFRLNCITNDLYRRTD